METMASDEELYKIIIETIEAVKGDYSKEILIRDCADKLSIDIKAVEEALEYHLQSQEEKQV